MGQNDTSQPSSITEVDLQAYMDGQLDDARRIEVEDFLAHHPEAAAEVMASLRTMDALRLHAQLQDEPSARLVTGATRLEQGLKRQVWQRTVLRLTGLAAAITAGWIIFSAVQPFNGAIQTEAATLAFVDDALDARRAQSLRQRMASQVETARYDPAELRMETDLAMPALPAGWKVVDVQIYPWDEGYSIAVTADAGDLGTVTLFAAPHVPKAPGGMRTTIVGGTTATFWQSGGLAYALVGHASESRLQAAAEVLLSSLQTEPPEIADHMKTAEDSF